RPQRGQGAGLARAQVLGWRRVARYMRPALAVVVMLLVGLLASPGASAETTPWARREWGYLTTKDGVQLRYSVLLPAAKGRFPVLLNYSGYDAGTIGGDAYQQGE